MLMKKTKPNVEEKRLREGVRHLRQHGIKPNQGGFWLQPFLTDLTPHLFLIGKRKIKLYLAKGDTSLIKESIFLFESSQKDNIAYSELAEFLENFEFYQATFKEPIYGFEKHVASLTQDF